MTFETARQVLLDAIAIRAFPGASVEVGSSRGPLWSDAFGRFTYDADSSPVTASAVYDLASLTKVIATTTVAMRLVDANRVRLHDAVGRWLPTWLDAARAGITIEQLLAHASGLPAWLPLFREHRGWHEYLSAISATPLEYPPGSQSVYSDLGFILLGGLLEEIEGRGLDALFAAVASDLSLQDIAYLPPTSWQSRTAPTEFDPLRGRLLVGDVHDENAAALGGVAGHAGLFGTAVAVGRFAREVLAARTGTAESALGARRETVLDFTTRRVVPGSSRALGWDTMLPTSSCGSLMSASAFGHVGFTGTSLWIDPALDLYVVLLTNRVYPSRENNRMAEVRPAFHNAVMEEVRSGR